MKYLLYLPFLFLCLTLKAKKIIIVQNKNTVISKNYFETSDSTKAFVIQVYLKKEKALLIFRTYNKDDLKFAVNITSKNKTSSFQYILNTLQRYYLTNAVIAPNESFYSVDTIILQLKNKTLLVVGGFFAEFFYIQNIKTDNNFSQSYILNKSLQPLNKENSTNIKLENIRSKETFNTSQNYLVQKQKNTFLFYRSKTFCSDCDIGHINYLILKKNKVFSYSAPVCRFRKFIDIELDCSSPKWFNIIR